MLMSSIKAWPGERERVSDEEPSAPLALPWPLVGTLGSHRAVAGHTHRIRASLGAIVCRRRRSVWP